MFLGSVFGGRMINKIASSSFTGSETVRSIYNCRNFKKIKVQ
jgi:hypothetical protein